MNYFGLIILTSIIATVAVIWYVKSDSKKKKEKSWLPESTFRLLKIFLSVFYILLWIYLKKDAIEKFFSVILLSIPFFFLFMHIRSLDTSFLQYFYFSLVIICWLEVIVYFTLQKDNTKELISKERKQLMLFYSSNAPEPPEGFEAQNLKTRPKSQRLMYTVFGKNSMHPHREFFCNHYDDENCVFKKYTDSERRNSIIMSPEEIPVGLQEEIDEFYRLNSIAYTAVPEWELYAKMEKMVQWRFYYAEHMTNHNLKNVK